MKKIFFLTADEYLVLMAGKGVSFFYGLSDGGNGPDEAAVCLAMAHLYQTGLIGSDGENFSIQQELDGLLEQIRQAEYAWLIRSGRDENKVVCCYECENAYAAVALSDAEKNTWKITRTDAAQIMQRIKTGMDEKLPYQPVLEEEELYQSIIQSKESVRKEDIRKYRNFAVVAEKISAKDGDVRKRLFVRMTPDGARIDMQECQKMLRQDEACVEETEKYALEWFMGGTEK